RTELRNRCCCFRGVLAEQEPVALVAVQPGGHERPDAVDTLAAKVDGQSAVPLLLEQLVRPPVPDLHRPRAVLAGGYDALERAVVERMVLDVNREMALARLEPKALRNRPARERARPLEPQVVVESPGVVALDHEHRRAARSIPAERLGRPRGIALAPVVAELGHHPRSSHGRLTRKRHQSFTPSQHVEENAWKSVVSQPGISLWKVWRARQPVRPTRGRPSSGTWPSERAAARP